MKNTKIKNMKNTKIKKISFIFIFFIINFYSIIQKDFI